MGPIRRGPATETLFQQTAMTRDNVRARRLMIVLGIVGLVTIWGIVLAVGVYRFRLYPEVPDPQEAIRGLRRGLLVVGCVASFLIVWLAALALQGRRRRPPGG